MMIFSARTGWAMAAALCVGAPAVVAAADSKISESDREFLTMAEGACNSGEFAAFFWPFANSRVVRDRYTAPHVRSGAAAGARDVPAARYLAADDFPVMMMDYSYVTGGSARRFDAEGGDASQLVYVQVDFRTSATGTERVDWVPGRFEPGEGDGPGTLIEKTGPGGYLTFRRNGSCWQLTEDIRNPAVAG